MSNDKNRPDLVGEGTEPGEAQNPAAGCLPF